MRINEILAVIPQSDDLLIFDAFSTGQWDLDLEHDDLAEADRARQKLISAGVDAFRKKSPDARQQVDGLVQLVKDAEACAVELGNKPGNFIAELCSDDFVREFLAYAMGDPHPLLAQMISPSLRWLREKDPAGYKAVGCTTATYKNFVLGYDTANAVCYGPHLNTPLPEDVAILQVLARHPALAVRHSTLFCIRLGAREKYEREAIDMLLACDVGDDSKMADEMCGAADYGGINKKHLSQHEVRALLNKLVITKEIDGHHTERFLAWVGEAYPEAFFEFIREVPRCAPPFPA